MSIIDIAAKLFAQKTGASNLDVSSVAPALLKLFPTNGSEIDMGGLISKFTSQSGGIASLAASWLGDGGNESVSADTIVSLLGKDKVSDFAGALSMDTDTAAKGLSGMIPELIDKSSEGGSLTKDVAANLGKKLLGSLF